MQFMRPMDLYTEKTVRDGNPDKIASSLAMLSDVQSISLLGLTKDQGRHGKRSEPSDKHASKTKASTGDNFHTAEGMGGRDKLALASIAFCSPLMILGIGASFAVADHLRMNREASLKAGHEFTSKASQFVSREEEERPRKRAVLSMPTEGSAARPEARRIDPERKVRLEYKNRKDNLLFPSEQNWRPQPSPERSWVKASKLLKRKLALQDQLQKYRGLLELSTVSAIVAQIENLDKDLKKVGC